MRAPCQIPYYSASSPYMLFISYFCTCFLGWCIFSVLPGACSRWWLTYKVDFFHREPSCALGSSSLGFLQILCFPLAWFVVSHCRYPWGVFHLLLYMQTQLHGLASSSVSFCIASFAELPLSVPTMVLMAKFCVVWSFAWFFLEHPPHITSA